MVGGMGGLTQGFADLATGEEKAEMMDPRAVMGNLQGNKMLMGPQMQAIADGGGAGRGAPRRMIGAGPSSGNGGMI